MTADANEDVLLAPTLATTFLGCRRAAAWDLEVRRRIRAAPPVPAGQASLLSRKGMEHEQACREALRAEYGTVLDVPAHGGFAARLARTGEAMAAGAPVIAQGAIVAGRWTGYADFLVRVDRPGTRWTWSYEPWDAKLAQTARPEHLLQLCLYADMLGAVQGVVPRHGRLLLGGTPTTDATPECRPFHDRVLASFVLADFSHYARRVAHGFEHFVDRPTGSDDDPDPCAACPTCRWQSACAALWDAHDHLCRVADITKLQTRRLRAAGIGTMAALAALDPDGAAGTRDPAHISGLNPDILRRLAAQARLETQSEATGEGLWRMLPAAPGRGFARLPPPDPGDLFFDFEGDPLYPGGLEYLCGVLWREPGEAEPVFRAFWAEDRVSEKCAFDGLMRFITAHLAAHPGAHLYHYAPYERSALARLASMHALHEEAVDDLLRQGRMIDLYRVVREALLIGERSYSIKALERFYMDKRQTQVVSGGDSVVAYDRWRRTGAESIRRDIEAYNRDDCRSTLGLRDWLLRIRPAIPAPAPESADPAAEPEEQDRRRKREEAAAAQAEIEARLIEGAPDQPDYRRRVADLVGFHRREAKPGWWGFFDRQERSAEELSDDGECLGGLTADGDDWIGEDKRSNTFRYRFPAQETKLKAGDRACIAGLPGQVTVHALDEDAGVVVLKRGKAQPQLPRSVSVIPDKPIDAGILSAAVRAVAEDIADGRGGVPHIEALLRRDLPNLAGRAPGLPLIDPQDADDPARMLQGAEAAVAALDRSWLFIQGPPGAGKTYLTSHLILAMLRQGRRVGVSSNSHKAIANLLHAVEKRADEAGFTNWRGQNRTPDDWRGSRIERAESGHIDPDADLLAGTAWLFARPELRGNRDILFVDEAGQVSLGHLIAMAHGARNIVLVGDQMQLGQPIQGAHPGESGLSVLDFLLGGAAVIPPERGIFLPITWRMHPDLCRFVSDAVYEGRLHAERGCAGQRLVLAPDAHAALKPAGLGFVTVDHEGNGQRSPEEADAVAAIYRSLLRQHVVDRHGVERPIAPDDVLVIAPYNMQVNLLRQRLGASARVGTVDRFQGQEAEVVLVSMATSGADDMPRDVSFLLSRNRLNVALSRARCLAVMVASPGLLDMSVRTVEEMRLANLLCWAKDYAEDLSAGVRGNETRLPPKRS